MEGMELIHLNVGGVMYTTTKATLCKYRDSMLGAMFIGSMRSATDQNDCPFIDRDGEMFKYILNFLRSSKLSLPDDFKDFDLLAVEADFYQIQPLIDALSMLRDERQRDDLKTHFFVEVIEVRTGTTATMPSNNSRVKTVLAGRKDVILSLPSELVGEGASEKLQKNEGFDYVELQLNGANVRLRLAETLRNGGWHIVDTNLSSSSSLVTSFTGNTLFIEQSYRDRWRLTLPKIKKLATYM
ncbi:BTB/POZ domain-containing protein KCTD6-like [Mizuhopecten yessoensis]|uniref:BTB/POZ domain-containing protein KCTD21 n=1 Tax=Mizuhopecten yessoensis TaxID=6573 RepID=A0A210QZJ6_MIZYE|nr:BTB/POZ domain-containing protein KCTD6-like [Mizuhopecten yessoensis]OWF54174.1 BTB/POZ domain-containing protein KCTD21 [Mizuhopecten yessoensis]